MGKVKLPTSSFTDQELKFSYWYVTHKLLLRKIVIIVLVIISLIFWTYSLFGLITFLLDYKKIDDQIKQLLFSPAATLLTAEEVAPKSFNLSNNISFTGLKDTFDLAAQIENINKDWLVEFNYNFRSKSTSSVVQKGFLLPQETKYLMDLGGADSNASLEISNIKWRRIVNYDKIKESHYRFVIENQEFIPASKPENPSRLKFDVLNDSPYGYWEAQVLVELYSNGNLVAVNRAPLLAIKSGEKRTIELNWLQDLPNIDDIAITVDVNFLDDNNIMSLKQQL